MRKLLSFHQQGGRQKLSDIAAGLLPASKMKTSPTIRLGHLLDNQAIPTENERTALYRYASLEADLIDYIEESIKAGSIPVGTRKRQTRFADVLKPILSKLSDQGINKTQFALLSANPPVSGGIPVYQPDLSSWSTGRTRITLEKLRSLIAGLKRLESRQLCNPVSFEEIARLVIAAGFSSEQLTDTTPDIVARIDDKTRIKPLLRALQSAVDTSFWVEEAYRRSVELGHSVSGVGVLVFLASSEGRLSCRPTNS